MPAVAPPRRRLDSLHAPRGKVPSRPTAKKPSTPTCCDNPKIEEEEGAKICTNCFTQLSESNIVADVTFEEDARGAAQVQGGFIGENARHARTLGAGAYRRVGGGERNTLAEIESNGRRALNALCPRLGVDNITQTQAGFLWGLAAKINFAAGRKTDEVVAACLYIACRRQRDNGILLMDISEILRINVFRLGEVYKDLVKELYIEGDEKVGVQHLVDVEPLIMKYCGKLEFGEKTRQVAEDAVKIMRRMKRDWIHTGRHPAGLCGACIILAARMNNFRRTVREVVYVSKVADVTVAKRVEEFRRTKSATLTVDQFRTIGNRIKYSHDPPSFYEAAYRQQKLEVKKRKRQASKKGQDQEVIEIPDDTESSRASSVVSSSVEDEQEAEVEGPNKRQRTDQVLPPEALATLEQQPRFDNDGFAIPALPVEIGPNGELAPPPWKRAKRGRPKKDKSDQPPPIVISEEELADENALENEIEQMLGDSEVIDAGNEEAQGKRVKDSEDLASTQRKVEAEAAQARRDAAGIAWWNNKRIADGVALGAEDLEDEFADDPEVANCVLNEDEQRQKEKIWVYMNEDWLRAQHEKEILKKIAEAEGTHKKRGQGGKRKKKGKAADGQLTTEAGTPIETPADPSAAANARRAQAAFSKHVDYEMLARVYGERASASLSRASSETPSDGRSASRASTPFRNLLPGVTASPTALAPQPGLQSPPATQARPQPSPDAGRAAVPAPQTVPRSPPATQPQQPAAEPVVEDEEEVVEDEDEEIRDNVSLGSDYEGDFGDDREDIGEDDYDRALDPMGGNALDGTYGDEDY